jgi:hypothetical protein
MLGASFFVDQDDQTRRGASNLLRTIAHQLALCDRSFGDALCAHLREKPPSVSRSLETQIADFVINPAAALSVSNQAPLVIVIDALDECETDSRGRPAGNLLPLFIRGLMTLSGRLKLFLTSRTEPVIQKMFDELSASDNRTVVELHDLDESIVKADIMTYLRYSFEQIRADMSYRHNLTHWPSSEDLEQLVKLSGALFVYASTIVGYVGSRRYSPRDRLAQVLGQQRIGPVTTPYQILDTLYMQVVEEAAGIRSRNPRESLRPKEVDAFCQRVRAIVAVIVLVQIPLQPDAVAALAGVDLGDALTTMEDLSALLLVKDGQPVRVFHKSFSDFMLDPDRCCESRLHLDSAVDHASLALRCLRIMNKSLRYNICEISDPDVPNAEVTDLKMRLATHATEVLRYASCFWMTHTAKSGPPDDQLREELAIFCRKNLFHWLELLSLLQFWSSTESEILRVIEWCEVRWTIYLSVCPTDHKFNRSMNSTPAAPGLRNSCRTCCRRSKYMAYQFGPTLCTCIAVPSSPCPHARYGTHLLKSKLQTCCRICFRPELHNLVKQAMC